MNQKEMQAHAEEDEKVAMLEFLRDHPDMMILPEEARALLLGAFRAGFWRGYRKGLTFFDLIQKS